MNLLEIKNLCSYYHGEDTCPLQYMHSVVAKLWHAEKSVCERYMSIIHDRNPSYYFTQYVVDKIIKDNPFDFEEIINELFLNNPTLQSGFEKNYY